MKVRIKKYFNKNITQIFPKKFLDNRGFFMETFQKKIFNDLGIKDNFKQENISFSKNKNTFRGIHFQTYPKAQSKLVTVLSGEILDIIIDLRFRSKTFGKSITINLGADKMSMLYIPSGFGHGFLTLKKNTLVSYKVSEYYSPKNEKTLSIKDNKININLGISKNKLIMSEKDKKGLKLEEIKKIRFK